MQTVFWGWKSICFNWFPIQSTIAASYIVHRQDEPKLGREIHFPRIGYLKSRLSFAHISERIFKEGKQFGAGGRICNLNQIWTWHVKRSWFQALKLDAAVEHVITCMRQHVTGHTLDKFGTDCMFVYLLNLCENDNRWYSKNGARSRKCLRTVCAKCKVYVYTEIFSIRIPQFSQQNSKMVLGIEVAL